MKTIKTLLISSCLLFALPNLAVLANTDTAVTQNNENKASAKDGEIIAFINGINTQEINEANVALQKQVSDPVKQFATLMKDDHNKSLSDIKSLNIEPNQTKEVEKFQDEGQKELKTLSALNGHEFEIAYADDMIKGHKKALEVVEKFIGETKNAELKAYLIKLKATIQMHLQHAETLKSSLKQ